MSFLSNPTDLHIIEKAKQGYSKTVIMLTVGLIISGVATVSLFKYQTQRQGLPKSSISLQTFFVFVSQFLNLIIFFVKITWNDWRLAKHFRKYRNRSFANGRKYEFATRIILPASLFSCLASLFQLYALYSLSSGFFQMLYGFGIVFAPLLSNVFLRRTLFPHIIAGIAICVGAFLIVFMSSYFLGYAEFAGDGDWKVILVMLLGVFFSSCQRVYQEYVNTRVEVSPFRFSGLEGFYGSVILCGFHLVMFVTNYARDTDYFDIGREMVFWYKNDGLVISSFFLLVFLSLYDLLGISLVSKTGATYRVTNDVVRVIFLWIIDIVLYENQEKGWKYWLNFAIIMFAYGILLFGSLVINEVIELKIWGLDKYFGLYRKSEELRGENNSDSVDERDKVQQGEI